MSRPQPTQVVLRLSGSQYPAHSRAEGRFSGGLDRDLVELPPGEPRAAPPRLDLDSLVVAPDPEHMARSRESFQQALKPGMHGGVLFHGPAREITTR